ncbi:MAG: ATP-binding protein [Prevotellaceae bacterium]|nr:ATP-binding protein [Candidatus Minthosoma caballi]
MLNRILSLQDIQEDSLFLWGPRQTGKSTLLQAMFPNVPYYDLLKSDVYMKYKLKPSLLRDECMMMDEGEIVIIDEVQKIPALLDEVHWLIVNKGLHFILCGSSARKLKRVGANLLGGRALRKVLNPLVSAEIPDFDIDKAVRNGLLPRHYLIENPEKRLQAYIGDYLQQEIISEALVRNLDSFTRFLEVAALSDSEMVNYTKIACECGVSSKTIKEYFSILEETLVGFYLPAYTKVIKRRVQVSPKFYFFDVGVVNFLLHRVNLQRGTVEYGHAFEHLIMQELKAWAGYSGTRKELSFWHTQNNAYEVDAVLGDAEVAIEIKSSQQVNSSHLKGLKAFKEEHPGCRLIVVSLDDKPRMLNDVEIWPAKKFLEKLWGGKIVEP